MSDGPALRVVPSAPAQRAGDPGVPVAAFFRGDFERLAIATAACGLGIEIGPGEYGVRGNTRQLANLRDALAERGSPLAGALAAFLDPVAAWAVKGGVLPLDRPLVMGILNLTDDSFSGDGVGRDIGGALRHAAALRDAGADIIDVGAETARADRPVVEAEAEAALVGPAMAALAGEGHTLSIDTYKPVVAAAALAAGAAIVNDISGLTLGTGAAEQAAAAGAGYVLNYSYSVPKQRPPSPPVYADVVRETVSWMEVRLGALRAAGLPREAIAIDPGIAFGKSHAEDIAAIRRIGELTTFGLPVLLAHSRKNFIGSITARPPADRDLETHIASVVAFQQGARLFRVHDVAGARRALDFAHALLVEGIDAFAPGEGSWPWRAGASAAHMTRGQADKEAPTGQRW